MEMVEVCTMDRQGITLLMLHVVLASSEIRKRMLSCNTLLETSGAFGVKCSSNEI